MLGAGSIRARCPPVGPMSPGTTIPLVVASNTGVANSQKSSLSQASGLRRRSHSDSSRSPRRLQAAANPRFTCDTSWSRPRPSQMAATEVSPLLSTT